MYIKQLVIHGFRSYGDQTIVEPFDKHINVVVGRNGSGKSNFFAAIRFVLGDAFNQMSKEERQALLFEGSDSITMSAYVELVLDNSDHRVPSGHDQVVIRRTVGLRKDEFSLDGKNITKKEMSNLLETAGFSKVNPFYIVPQGRVTSLTNAKDHERLAILREIAGTSVYESKKEESNKLLKYSQLKMKDVDENLQVLDEKLSDLKREMTEYEEFQDLDRQKKCLDYTLLDREMHEVDSRLTILENARDDDLKMTEDAFEEFERVEEERAELEKSMLSIKAKNESLVLEKATIGQDLDETLLKLAEVTTKVQEAESTISSTQNLTESGEKGALVMKNRIGEIEKRIQEIAPKLDGLDHQEETLQSKVDTLHALQMKLAHTKLFANKTARDTWLKLQSKQLQKQIAERQSFLTELQQDLETIQSQYKEVYEELKQKRDELENVFTESQNLAKQLSTAESNKDKVLDERKQLWREESKVDMAMDLANKSLQEAEKNISKLMSRDLCSGLVAIPRLAPAAGYYGPLCHLISTDTPFKLALESVAGNSLFHHVVETDSVASDIIDLLSKENAGRATFIPLNRIKQQEIVYPEDSSVMPLINKITVDERFLPAVKQIFGNVLLCKDLETCHRYAVSKRMVTVTLQGDRIDPRGVLVGGFQDLRNSRLDAAKEVKHSQDTLSQLASQKQELHDKLKEVDQRVTFSLNETQKLSRQKQQHEDALDRLNGEVLKSLNQQEFQLRELISSKQTAIKELTNTMASLEQQYQNHESDLQKPFSMGVDPWDARQMETISEQLPALQMSLDTLKDERRVLEDEKKLLQLELREIQYNQEENLLNSSYQISESNYDDVVRTGLDNINELETTVSRLREEQRRVSKALEKSSKEMDASKAKLDTIDQNLDKAALLFQKMQKKVEKSTARRNLLMGRKDELALKVRQLGFLPEEAFVRFRDLASEDILSRLGEITEDLKKYQHINKKAIEQFQMFTKQRASLGERRDQLNESYGSIRSLIETLDARKQAAIQRTFKQVAKSFEEVFSRLVPGGSAQLVMQKKSHPLSPDTSVHSDEENNGDGEAEDDELNVEYESDASQTDIQDDFDDFVGASIVVAFSKGIHQRIEQLSGGQKSLCALALILAIQQCDPAPFYLFDEIDANLDTQYRAAVANMISHVSNSTGAQFICTTFRPELLTVATKFYGVFFHSRRSSVAVISQDDALSFVQTSV